MHASPMPFVTGLAVRGRGLCKSYVSGRVETPVLRDLSFDLLPAQLTLLEGPSGCGKSTLLALLSGLLRPDAGQVEALDRPLWSLSPRDLERFRLEHVGFVFQGFNLFAALSAREQVMLPLDHLGLRADTAQARADAALAEVGMLERAHLRPAEMSGGEKQRVAIARALAKQPTLLFADEPTSALDAANGRRVIQLLHGVARAHGTAVLCVSHDPRLIGEGDRVLQMEDGRILTDVQRRVPQEVVA